jgi:iron complex outermembrane receptor protein
VTDISITDQLALLFSGRYDHYSFKTIDEGTIDFGGDAARFILAEGDEDAFSYSISGSYDFGGVIPYVTYANGNEPLTNSSGGVSPGTIVGNGGILADSELLEAGIKFELLDETLFATFAIYQQERVDLDIAGNQLAEESEGFEAELNWVIDPNWAVTGAATFMNVEIKDPDPDNCAAGFGQGEFINVAPTDPSIYFFNAAIFDTTPIPLTGATGYGGIYRALNASCLPELADGYDREGIPERVLSLFFTYTSDETDFGTFGATFGGTYVSETGTLPVADEVRYPDYTVFRLAAFAEYKNFSLVGTIDNLFDKEYFVSSEGTFQNVSVHPGRGRIWRLKGKVSF